MDKPSLPIQPGDIVSSSRWPELLKVDLIEPVTAGYGRVVGVLLTSHRHIDQLVPLAELSTLHEGVAHNQFDASPRDVFLALEARRYRYAALYDPLLAVNISKVDPLPHQIEAVYGYVLRQPRVRFLIADDPGAGKTIMAGLVVKEMKLRGLVRRILIIAPGHLRDQWQRELSERFDEHFVPIDRQTIRNHFGENIWEREMQVITSLDFIRQDDVMHSLAGVNWDLTIVDEAHKMAAYRYGDKTEKTRRYRVGELLSKTSAQLLFLTATPHRGDSENFRLFLDLLQPGAFATGEMVQSSILKGDNPLFIRRLKEDLRDFEGRPLFLPRHVKTITFNLGVESPAEKELYNALSRYVTAQYNKALAHTDRQRNIAFALVILQRRFASSVYALYRSLERRKQRLEELRRHADSLQNRSYGALSVLDPDETEEMSELERWSEETLWETLSVAGNRAELDAELSTLDQLLRQARIVAEQKSEPKLRRLEEALRQAQQAEPGVKVLIFTESRDTLDYLERCLREWGYTVCAIHGGMPLPDRIDAERVFKNEAQIMVATEAAGEGINLQFCHVMINYDIPWNPNRLEQRMGRIHRYGQTREVTIFNLVAEDTREGCVLARLFQKLEEIRAALGSDRVFDVIDELFPGHHLAALLTEAAANARTVEDILRDIDIRLDRDYLRRVRDQLGESLATRYIDYTQIREMNARARERRLIPEYTQAFFRKAWERLGGELRETRRDGFFTLERVPPVLRNIAEQNDFQKRFGTLLRHYPLITFDKQLAMHDAQAEFVSFGHPLFEAVLCWIERDLSAALLRGTTFFDPDGRLDGALLFYEGQIHDGAGQVAGKRLFALFIPCAGDASDAAPRSVDPAIVWDLAPADGSLSTNDLPSLEALQQRSLAWLIPALETYQQELMVERQRQANIKRRYGLESLRHLILELDNDLLRLQERANQGEDVALAIRNKTQQRDDYLRARNDLQRQIERECRLTLATPQFTAAVRVLPLRVSGDTPPAANAPAVERAGMEYVLRYERAQGRDPHDVSTENLGYDVRSLTPADTSVRYIEVKARAGVGAVVLTQNEWFAAQRLGDDYFLYVLFNALDDNPILYVIRNPADRLQPKEQREVRYLVSSDEIAAASQPVA
ncbi:MAG: helicase-related protein [Anaerolineae bacterium]|nr:helicase-related protein [Thermoflexales bacterium]MDW8408513.1 helicase-related protein [Anaerolineae bacterium]